MLNVAERISQLRKQQTLSLRALAESAGISAAALSQIESQQSSPSVATLEKLAEALHVGIAALFVEQREPAEVEIIDLDSRKSFPLQHGGRLIPLTANERPTGFDPIFVQLTPSEHFNEEPYGLVGRQAFVWMRRGRAVLEFGNKSFDVHETQCVYYDPRKPHNWHNISDDVCELILVRSK
ncbi:MAG: helix-turn-helix domain-containing protein [Mariprofundaceae bacterium]